MKNKYLLVIGLLILALNLSVSASSKSSFSDVNNVHPNKKAIEFLWQENVLSGYADGTFRPDKTVNRAELLKILIAGLDIQPDPEIYQNCFPDVNNEWFASYICYARENQWVKGYADGNFKPAQTVSKAEAIKMLINTQEIEVDSDIENDVFEDVDHFSWYAPYIVVANNRGLLSEVNLYKPTAGMTRAMISENIYRSVIIKENNLEHFNEYQDVESELYQVLKVVDGDTIQVDIDGQKKTVRLIGMDTPESVHPKKTVQCFGVEASNKAKELLNNKKVILEVDPTQADSDIYGRLLRYVFLENGENFNLMMIREGYAYEYTYKNSKYKYQDDFRNAEKEAKENDNGLWSEDTCNGERY